LKEAVRDVVVVVVIITLPSSGRSIGDHGALTEYKALSTSMATAPKPTAKHGPMIRVFMP
jgi:hypothetical protein